MCFTVIPKKISNPFSRLQELSSCTVHSLLYDYQTSPECQHHIKGFDECIKRKIGDPITETDIDKFEEEIVPYKDEALQGMKLADPEAPITDKDDSPTPEEDDKYIGMEVLLPIGHGHQHTKVDNRKWNVDV